MKGSSFLQNICKRQGVLTSSVHRWIGTYELKKGTLVYSQAEGQGPVMQAIKYDYNNKSKKERQVKGTVSNMESELASFLQYFCSEILG